MPRVDLDGKEVHTSRLTQRSFRAAYCDFLLPVTSENKEEMLAEFKRGGAIGGKYCGLKVFDLADLSFLQDFPLLLYLELIGPVDFKTKHLEVLSNLRGLRIETPGSGIDFTCHPLLEVFMGDWHIDNRNLHRASELRQLRASQFKPRSRDLSVLAEMTRLETLDLIQTNITSLDGLETLGDLRYLEIAYATQLKSLDAFGREVLGIREIEFQNCKRIASYKPIAAIPQLRRLKLSSCAATRDLKWMNGMKNLDFFSFVGTNIEDGDLSPLLELPELRYAGTMNRRHYNLKADEINERLGQHERTR